MNKIKQWKELTFVEQEPYIVRATYIVEHGYIQFSASMDRAEAIEKLARNAYNMELAKKNEI